MILSKSPKHGGQNASSTAKGPRASKRIVVGDIESLIPNYKQKRIGVIRFRSSGEQGKNEIVLSEGGNMREAAQNLFSALRKMDNSDIDIILAEEAPEEGLGLAINDRLRRAASDK